MFVCKFEEREEIAQLAEAAGIHTCKLELEEREKIAQLAEAAGIHTCKLELEDYLMLEKWYARTGSYMMPCSSCVAAREPSVAISTKSPLVESGMLNASKLDQDGLIRGEE